MTQHTEQDWDWLDEWIDYIDGSSYRKIRAKKKLRELVEQMVIESYDKGYEAGENATPPPLKDAVEFRREQYGWSAEKMAAMLDIEKSHYSEFVNGKRNLPINSIRKAYAIGIPATVLLQEQLKHSRK